MAHGLRGFQDADWTTDIGRGQTTIKVVVKQPVIEHEVFASATSRPGSNQLAAFPPK